MFFFSFGFFLRKTGVQRNALPHLFFFFGRAFFSLKATIADRKTETERRREKERKNGREPGERERELHRDRPADGEGHRVVSKQRKQRKKTEPPHENQSWEEQKVDQTETELYGVLRNEYGKT